MNTAMSNVISFPRRNRQPAAAVQPVAITLFRPDGIPARHGDWVRVYSRSGGVMDGMIIETGDIVGGVQTYSVQRTDGRRTTAHADWMQYAGHGCEARTQTKDSAA